MKTLLDDASTASKRSISPSPAAARRPLPKVEGKTYNQNSPLPQSGKGQSHDLIIIGCGLVGGSLALALPESLSIAVVDAESPMSFQPGYLALNIHSCHILKALGIWEDIMGEELATPIHSIDVSELNQPTGKLRFHSEAIGEKALGYITSTAAIRKVLLNRIKHRPNIAWYCPEHAEVIDWPDDGMEKASVKLSQHTLTAKLVVIADGGRSQLRERLQLNLQQKTFNQHILITQLKMHEPHHGLAFERFTSHGPIALLPLHQDKVILVWTLPTKDIETYQKYSSTELLQALQSAYNNPAIQHWQEVGSRKTFPLNYSYINPPFKTRLVLMGNAAHTVHPVGAQGFNLSLNDVIILTCLIEDAIKQNRDIGHAELLKYYWSLRKDDTEFVVYFTESLLKIFSGGEVFSKARELGLALLEKSSWLKQKILKKTTGFGSLKSVLPLPQPSQKYLKTPEKYDIIIVGNRLIGSTLACALNPRYRIAVLDKASTPKKPEGAYQARINAYNRASETLLKTLNIWQMLPQERCFAFDKIFANSDNGQGHLTFCAKDIGETHIGHFIENDTVTYTLHHRLHQLSHIDFYDELSVTHIYPSDDFIEVITDNNQRFQGKLLAACDGGHSVVRTLLGIDVAYHPYYQRCIVGNIEFEGDLNKTAWQRFLKTGPIGLLPLTKGFCSLAWSCDQTTAEYLLALNEDDFIKALDKAIEGRLGKINRINLRQSFPLIAQHAENYTAPRTLLLGDAAHVIHPLAGLGANIGFQDVIAAAALLNNAEITHRDIGRRYLLESYEKARKRHNRTIMHTMTLLNDLFSQSTSPIHSIRSMALNLSNKITPVKNRMFKHAMWMNTTADEIHKAIKV